jgi:hypothetical protein
MSDFECNRMLKYNIQVLKLEYVGHLTGITELLILTFLGLQRTPC